jgi:putative ATP-dependent endonuclease of OLD family
MKLKWLRVCNFRSFGDPAVTVEFGNMTYLLGPNGSGKTAILQSLVRMFGIEPSLRRIRPDDFHVEVSPETGARKRATSLWIEAEFEFPTLADGLVLDAAVPPSFRHILLDHADGPAHMRIRLEASIDEDGEVEQELAYVTELDGDGKPLNKYTMHRDDRSLIQVHYLPARRDPSDHISFAANSMMGKLLRSANWNSERADITNLTDQIDGLLSASEAVVSMSSYLSKHWESLHRSAFHRDVQISFAGNDLDSLLRLLSVRFGPGHSGDLLDYSLLSDGQKSLLYISLVLALHGIGKAAMSGESSNFDVSKLRPPVFTFLAIEEPENSLSPHYLGRIAKSLREFSATHDGQSAIATHSPAMLRRTPPEDIRYLRLDKHRRTQVSTIRMPDAGEDGYKFVREAVQAFPELYFSRLVVLGEGDSEEIVLPRLLQARGIAVDDASVSVVPLGGKHVNHFWRLLDGLGIPYVTVLDLDLARHGGGWGRIKTALSYLEKYPGGHDVTGIDVLLPIPAWDASESLRDSQLAESLVSCLESFGVFFSSPLDLDFSMLSAFPNEYGALPAGQARESTDLVASVLGSSHGDESQYTAAELEMFGRYHGLFKLGSKPAAHLEAMAALDDAQLLDSCPPEYVRMVASVRTRLESLPE